LGKRYAKIQTINMVGVREDDDIKQSQDKAFGSRKDMIGGIFRRKRLKIFL